MSMSGSVGLAEHWRGWAARLEAALDSALPPATAEPCELHRAMRYSTLGGGKRLRGFLAIAAAEAVGGDGEAVLPLACALESIHAYSLIHDDLPCMDDDDFRRGKPSCHRAFSEHTAVLAGDALLTEAFIMLSTEAVSQALGDDRVLQVVQELAVASGSLGMAGGQAMDLAAEHLALQLPQLEAVHRRKTGALIRVAARGGAILSGCDATTLAALTEYAEQLGLAFQITDDLLDVTGDPNKLGKPVQNDGERGKATYPSLLGLGGAKAQAEAAIAMAKAAIQVLGEKNRYLVELADFVLSREQ